MLFMETFCNCIKNGTLKKLDKYIKECWLSNLYNKWKDSLKWGQIKKIMWCEIEETNLEKYMGHNAYCEDVPCN